MIYFLDPAGNILELIARHDIDTSSDQAFSSASLLAITEIGLACPDVPKAAAWLQNLGFVPYKEHGPSFTPIGDEHGLLILVSSGREWFPDTGVPAQALPTTIVLEADAGSVANELQMPNLPYRLIVRPAQL